MGKEREVATALAMICKHASTSLSANIGPGFDEGLNHDAWNLWSTAKRIDGLLFRVADKDGELVRALEFVRMADWCLTQASYGMNRAGCTDTSRDLDNAVERLHIFGASIVMALNAREDDRVGDSK